MLCSCSPALSGELQVVESDDEQPFWRVAEVRRKREGLVFVRFGGPRGTRHDSVDRRRVRPSYGLSPPLPEFDKVRPLLRVAALDGWLNRVRTPDSARYPCQAGLQRLGPRRSPLRITIVSAPRAVSPS